MKANNDNSVGTEVKNSLNHHRHVIIIIMTYMHTEKRKREINDIQ